MIYWDCVFGLKQAVWDKNPTSEADFILVFEILGRVLKDKNFLLILQCSHQQRNIVANIMEENKGTSICPFKDMRYFYYCKENSHDEGGLRFCSSVEEVLFLYSHGEQRK